MQNSKLFLWLNIFPKFSRYLLNLIRKGFVPFKTFFENIEAINYRANVFKKRIKKLWKKQMQDLNKPKLLLKKTVL